MSQENVEIVRGARIALPPLSERASQRRALDERLFVRFPALFACSPTPRFGCRRDLGFGD